MIHREYKDQKRKMKEARRIMIVDDDPLNNSLCRFVIHSVAPELEVIDFEFPERAMDHIREGGLSGTSNTILLLDINMPVMTGWEFLNALEQVPSDIRNKLTTFILSSSVDSEDKERARQNQLVTDYITKPLSPEAVRNILQKGDEGQR
jgi:CheY-like chemotaxis protein